MTVQVILDHFGHLKSLSHEQFVQALSIGFFFLNFDFLMNLQVEICKLFPNSQDNLWHEK